MWTAVKDILGIFFTTRVLRGMKTRYIVLYKARSRNTLKVTKHSRLQRKYYFLSQLFTCMSDPVKELDNTRLLLPVQTYYFSESCPNPRTNHCDKFPYCTFINIV